MAFPPNATHAQTKSKVNSTSVAAPVDSAAVDNPLEYIRPQLEYESAGKRDPFESLAPVEEEDGAKLKGLFNYEEARLNGIVNTGGDIYALVTDKGGLAYVLREGYRVFGGYVTDITDDAIQFHIVKYGRSMTIIMRFSSSKTTEIDEIGPDEVLIRRPGQTVQYKKSAAERAEEPTVLIEDVVLPSLDTRTIDETWFDTREKAGAEQKSDADTAKDSNGLRFTLIDPPSGTAVTLPFVLDWSTLEGEGWVYTLIVDDSLDYATPVFVKDGIGSTSFVFDEKTPLPTDTVLYWKVVAVNPSGAQAESRRTDMSFTIR